MQPILGCLGTSGIIKGLLAFSVSMGWMDPSWGTYQVLYAFGDGFFYFLPIFLGYTCAKKLNFDEFIGMAIGVGLVYPNMVAMQGSSPLGTIFAGTAFEMSYTTTFLKLPVFFPASGYPSSVVPVLLASLVTAKWVYPFFRKIFPDTVKLFLVPLCTVCVMLPLTYLVVGPVSSLLCGALQWFFGLIFNLPVVGGAVAGALVGAFWQVLVMFGLHWGLIPLMYSNIGTLGYDIVLSPNNVCSWTEFGILAAVVLKTKSTKTRGIAIPAMISAFFGISEPAIYGITLPKKKPFLCGLWHWRRSDRAAGCQVLSFRRFRPVCMAGIYQSQPSSGRKPAVQHACVYRSCCNCRHCYICDHLVHLQRRTGPQAHRCHTCIERTCFTGRAL